MTGSNSSSYKLLVETPTILPQGNQAFLFIILISSELPHPNANCKTKIVNGPEELYQKLRYPPRFFDQVGHQTTPAFIENKHFFTKSCHRQTYQNYEQPPQSFQNLYFQSHFLTSKINLNLSDFFFCEEYVTRRSTFINETF